MLWLGIVGPHVWSAFILKPGGYLLQPNRNATPIAWAGLSSAFTAESGMDDFGATSSVLSLGIIFCCSPASGV